MKAKRGRRHARRVSHDLSSPFYAPLRLLHILGAMLFLGGLVAVAYWKVSADRTNDPGYIARVHERIRRADKHVVGTGAFLTFAAGYAMVRFLGGRIAEHGFVLWGMIVMFTALGVWYFPLRRMTQMLVRDAETAWLKKEALPREFAARSVAWLTLAFIAISLVVIVTGMMVFKLPSA